MNLAGSRKESKISRPVLSIVTPVFNTSEYIGKCIENVVSQQCEDCEHIIIDGGSTDGTVQIIQSFAKQYSHIKWLSERDEGQSDAMNKGIAMAKGDVLGFLNADDYYEPDVLCHIVELFKKLPKPSFAAANCRIWQDNEHFHLHTPSDLRFISLVKKKSPHPYNPVAYFYHASLHQRVGLYDVNDHYTMDLDFILRVVRKAHCYYFDEIWGNMRYLPGSKTYDDNAEGKAMMRLKKTLQRHWEKAPLRLKLLYNCRPYFYKLVQWFVKG